MKSNQENLDLELCRGPAANVNFSQVDALFDEVWAKGRHQLTLSEMRRLSACAGMESGWLPRSQGGGLFVGVRTTREFGLVIEAGMSPTAGDGGTGDLRRPREIVGASTALTDAADFLERFESSRVFRMFGAAHQRDTARRRLLALFGTLLALAERYGTGASGSKLALEELVFETGGGGARCRIGPPASGPVPRPIAKIGKLLRPQSIGLIGASASKMNFGRIILKNLLASGYDPNKIVIIRPNETLIDGVRCVESLRTLEYKLDLLVVAVGAEAVFDLVEEVIGLDAAASVMLIPGGLGETRKSREAAQRMSASIEAAHRREGGGPVFLGGNCLGVVSHRGGYDSWFIPQDRLPRVRKKARRNSALVSQSGAFMIMRLSQNPWLDPDTMVAVGNQCDLTHGDLLTYLTQDDQIEVVGFYIEGFRDLGGLAFARAVRTAVLKGKQIVVYKAGRTAAGGIAALGHTASMAGEHALCQSVLAQAGAIVVSDIAQFDDVFYMASALHGKVCGGNRLGAVSGAGFETVGIADSLCGEDFAMQVAPLGEATGARLAQILTDKKLDALMEVRNPLDINPGADDETHAQCVRAMLEDQNIDAVVVGLDPVSPAMRALERSARTDFDIHSPESVVQLLAKVAATTPKLVVGIIDGGRLYDAMAGKLMDAGVCVFRSAQRGVEALVKYSGVRIYTQALRRAQESPEP